MTEEEARTCVAELVTPAALLRIERFVALVQEESARQNLVAKPTLDTIWLRHILDSAQLLPLAADAVDGPWIDIGTGAGFPGMIAALATERETLLVEPRRMRAAFLQHACEILGATQTAVIQARIERLEPRFAAIISARAVGFAPQILDGTTHLRTRETLYLLPKGQSATTECVAAQHAFSGLFHVEQSLTDPASGIIVARNVRAKR